MYRILTEKAIDIIKLQNKFSVWKTRKEHVLLGELRSQRLLRQNWIFHLRNLIESDFSANLIWSDFSASIDI